ncbi:hypothetical protein [Mesorhizobium sp. B2-4-6]|uniref:hypothetical protein n=1 Tax=Mesorhizobium sp. B2-4-6 TaxID=2589943 RepID=UPI00112ECEF3|nr:hypothetical protein [Mesorhizobium sp. B2-4-6]TPL49777.1 hypothetical protein FJ957_11980 [Mesorhizobium sp. B2-4-6]
MPGVVSANRQSVVAGIMPLALIALTTLSASSVVSHWSMLLVRYASVPVGWCCKQHQRRHGSTRLACSRAAFPIGAHARLAS